LHADLLWNVEVFDMVFLRKKLICITVVLKPLTLYPDLKPLFL
jgi:hypothetical protein